MAILVLAPEIYDQTLQLPLENRRPTELIFLAAISAFVGVLAVGVCVRWRWTFWLILVAFLFACCARQRPFWSSRACCPMPVRLGMWCFRPFLACFSPESDC